MNSIKLSVISTIAFAIATFGLSAQTSEWTKKSAKQWLNSGQWNNGWNIKPHKSVNIVEFAHQYHINKSVWDKLFEYLANNDLQTLSVGKHVIDGDNCWITVSEYTPKSADETAIESHRKYIDLQFTLSGDEKMGITHNAVEKAPYQEANDIIFYQPCKMKFYKTTPDRFFLFFPNDIHQPSVAGKTSTTSRKIVAKIIRGKR